MTFKVNGGIINEQTLTGSLRYFKMTGPFAWTVSNGSVNLPVSVSGGDVTATTYFVVGNDKPVPNSAAEFALQEISKQCSIAIISVQPASYGGTTQIHFAISASAVGWGANDPLTTAAEMQAAVQALGNKTVYITVGAANQATPPVTAVANLGTVTIVEVPFKLA
jgi:hypothetical protein